MHTCRHVHGQCTCVHGVSSFEKSLRRIRPCFFIKPVCKAHRTTWVQSGGPFLGMLSWRSDRHPGHAHTVQEWEILLCVSRGVLWVPLRPPWREGGGWEVCRQLPGARTSRALLLPLLPQGSGAAGVAGSLVSITSGCIP